MTDLYIQKDRVTAAAMLCSSDWNDEEKWVIRWKLGWLSEFEMALATAIDCADDPQISRLEESFPIQVGGFKSWSRGHLRTRLRAAGLTSI